MSPPGRKPAPGASPSSGRKTPPVVPAGRKGKAREAVARFKRGETEF